MYFPCHINTANVAAAIRHQGTRAIHLVRPATPYSNSTSKFYLSLDFRISMAKLRCAVNKFRTIRNYTCSILRSVFVCVCRSKHERKKEKKGSAFHGWSLVMLIHVWYGSLATPETSFIRMEQVFDLLFDSHQCTQIQINFWAHQNTRMLKKKRIFSLWITREICWFVACVLRSKYNSPSCRIRWAIVLVFIASSKCVVQKHLIYGENTLYAVALASANNSKW